MYWRDAVVTKIATIRRTPEKNNVKRSTWSPPKIAVGEFVNPSQTVEASATARPRIPTKGARLRGDFRTRRNPAGIARRPNTARLRKGVSEIRDKWD